MSILLSKISHHLSIVMTDRTSFRTENKKLADSKSISLLAPVRPPWLYPVITSCGYHLGLSHNYNFDLTWLNSMVSCCPCILLLFHLRALFLPSSLPLLHLLSYLTNCSWFFPKNYEMFDLLSISDVIVIQIIHWKVKIISRKCKL